VGTLWEQEEEEEEKEEKRKFVRQIFIFWELSIPLYEQNHTHSIEHLRIKFVVIFKLRSLKSSYFSGAIALCSSGHRETGTNSIDWSQLSTFHLKTETESSLIQRCVMLRDRTV
jgi:competence CoiA-like predicted nuclease